MTTEARKLRVLAISAGLLLALAIIGVLTAVLHARDQIDASHKRFAAFEDLNHEKHDLLADLQSAVGYGGLIHNFKNFVLRQDSETQDRLERDFDTVAALITQYGTLSLSTPERDALDVVQQTFQAYRERANIAETLMANNAPITEIDRAIEVDDQQTIEAFQVMHAELDQQGLAQESILADAISEGLTEISYSLLTIPVMVGAAFVILFLMRRMKHKMDRLQQEEQRLKATEARFANLVEGSLQGILVHRDLKPIFANQAFARMMGFESAAEVLALEDISVLFGRAQGEEFKALHKHLQSGDIPSWECRSQANHADGRAIWVEEVLRTVDWDGVPAVQGAYLDITERVESESTMEIERDRVEENAVELVRMAEDLDVALKLSEERQRELHRLSISDPLTGVYNRRYFMECGDDEQARLKRTPGQMLAIAMLDIDHFKNINDTHGHAAGDDALRAFSSACLETLREIDVFGRLGGEEFAVILPNSNREGAEIACERLREAASKIVVEGPNGPFGFTVSIGLCLDDTGDSSFEALLGTADEALYEAKEGGRNRVVLASASLEALPA
ncbi:MAG: diguanylate cyclase [Magnetovibrionaceae bacterium]